MFLLEERFETVAEQGLGRDFNLMKFRGGFLSFK